ncbi:MAG: PTS sugar transporter subunit IIA, partial [Erysipelotrichaceae bacterium]|nr:PTS sugar transporter subunit IIA [Erysipelotrichaceae bacterium]
MRDSIYVIEGSPENWREAIEETSSVLFKHGNVTEDFYENCVERELEFPTGLNTLLPVAIPHTNADSVINTGVCLLRTDKPIVFNRMEDVEKQIEVQFVLNLAINSGGAQLKALQQVIKIFQDEDFKEKSMQMSIDELQELFSHNWN